MCDPEKVMSTAAQDIVEDAINNATSAEIATVLIPHMDTSNYHSDIDETAKRMAMQLHDTVLNCNYSFIFTLTLTLTLIIIVM